LSRDGKVSAPTSYHEVLSTWQNGSLSGLGRVRFWG